MTISPDIQRKLRKHVLEVMPELQDRPPTFEDLTPGKMPYLEAVVQETLRLSRTAGGISREGRLPFSFVIHTSLPSCSNHFRLKSSTHPDVRELIGSDSRYYTPRSLHPKGNYDRHDFQHGI